MLPVCETHWLVVEEHGRLEVAAKPSDDLYRLLRIHVHQHTLCQDNGGEATNRQDRQTDKIDRQTKWTDRQNRQTDKMDRLTR